MINIISILLILSGAASLSYQVVWVRLLGLSLGSTSASVSTVLAAFFLGLALGSYLTAHLPRLTLGDFSPYILVEVLIGLFGLASLPIFLNLDLLLSFSPALGTSLTLKFVLSVCLLLLPTTCMGATFPIVASILMRGNADVGARISHVYGFNTLGAVLGACLGGFVLVPTVGLDGTIFVAVAINFAVAIAATCIQLRIGRQISPPPTEQGDIANPNSEMGTAPPSTLAGIALLATGFGSIATQVGWTKYLAIFTGSTIYGFSAILAIFLTGITLGALAAERFIDRIRNPQALLPLALCTLGISFLATRSSLSLLPHFQYFLNNAGVSDSLEHIIRYATTAAIILPPTLILGALFPLNLKIFCGGMSLVKSRIGKAYAINTVAGIFGAIFAGFVAIPMFGTDGLLLGVGLATVALAILWLPSLETLGSRISIMILLTISIAGTWIFPGLNYQKIISTVGYDTRSSKGDFPDFLFLEEGKSGVVSLTSYDNVNIQLQNNGLNESHFRPDRDDYTQKTEALLGLLPYMLHPNQPTNAFVLGFGGGHTTRMLTLTDISKIKVVELEPAVVRAGMSVGSKVDEVLRNPKVSIEYNDARNDLLVHPQMYDIIVSQPSHPWIAGAANVFTQDFWDIAHSRLHDDGLFGQWVNLFSMNTSTLKSLLVAFYNVFEHGMVFADLDKGNLILIGSKNPLVFEITRVNNIISTPGIRPLMRYVGIEDAKDIVWYYAFSRSIALSAAGDATANRDTNLLSEVNLAYGIDHVSDLEDPYHFVKQHSRLDIDQYIDDINVDMINAFSNYMLFWGSPNKSFEIADWGHSVDPLVRQSIIFRTLISEERYSEAFSLFASRIDWHDNIVIAHIESLLRVGLHERAVDNLALIDDFPTKITQQSKILFYQGRYNEVILLPSDNLTSDIWHVLAASKLSRHSKLISKSAYEDVDPLSMINIMLHNLKIYNLEGDISDITRASTELISTLSDEIDKLSSIEADALIEEDMELANSIRRSIWLLGGGDVDEPAFKEARWRAPSLQ